MGVKNKIEYLIDYEMPDTLWSHLKSLFYRRKWCGFIHDNEFTVWKHDYWSGFLYPIIKGKIDGNKVDLTYNLNPLGGILYFILAVVFPLLIISTPVRVLLNGEGTFLLFGVVLVIPLFFYLPMRYVCKRALNIALEDFSEYLKAEVEQEG